MINFCVEPKKPCRKNPIGELDFKIDKCYSSIYSRLCCHENDSVSHISQEERDEWNGKASNSALLDLQDQLNEIAGDGDNSIKKEILIEVSKQISGAIDDLNLGDYAKKKYVDDAISNINFDQYITKKNADSTYLNKADYIKFDPTNYYTIAQIQKIIEDSTIGKDYPIESFTLEHNDLILTQKNGGQFRVSLSESGSESGSDGGVNADYVQEQLLNYIKKNTLSKLVINDKAYSIESGRDIKIPISGAGSSIDYTKFGYNKSYFKQQAINLPAPSRPSANMPPEDGSGWVDDAPDQKAGYYIWMTQVFINGNGQYGEYTNPICLTGTAGENAISYDIKTSTSTINYQDGTMYPKTINVYVVKSNGSQITNITPSNGSDWSFSYSVDGGTTWTEISSDQIQTEGDNGMLFKATNGTIVLSEYVPIVRSGINGSTYSLQLSNILLSYVPADQNYNLQMSCNVNLYKNESSVDSTNANLYNLYMQLNSNDRTTLQYNTDHWDAIVNTTVQSKSSTITIYAYNTNGSYLTSMTIPVSASGDSSIGQTFKGSPLRITGEWQSATKYYDGKRSAENGIFYQDVVLYKGVYYACINTDSGEADYWQTPPITATYWSAFSLSPNVVADLVIANKAFIKELSSNELVIFDGQKIVAGMTSSKAVDESSPLNGKVTTEGKGDVRIWAGEISNADLTTAPFTVTNTGEVKSTKANITGQVNATSGSIGNLSITGRMTGDSTGGFLVIDGSSVALYGDDDDWSDGSRIKFYASNSQARGLISGMTNDTDSVLTIDKIGSGLDAHSGYGPCLRLNGEFAFDRVLDINGTVTGLCRDQKIYDFSKTPKPTSFFDDNSSLYVFNNLTQEITVPLVDDFLGREFQIVNLSRYNIKLTRPSSIRMLVGSNGVIPISEDVFTLKPYTTVHVIQSYDEVGSCLYFYY